VAYFGKRCIEYPIGRAIDERKLTPYRYYPHTTSLTDTELYRYQAITREIGRHIIGQTKSGAPIFDKTGEMLLLQRARLIAAASKKIELLSKLIVPYRNDTHILVYCGAAKLLSDGDEYLPIEESEERQIDVVVQLLGKQLDMRVSKFTAEEDIVERKELKAKFSKGDLQALVAIKCLDEGVNIPSIRTAFMLASTTNPKEYIQRRGRLLRLDEEHGKEYAEIFDMITLPRPLEEVYGMTEAEREKDLGLVNRELARAYEFTRIAANFDTAQPLLDTIRSAYRLDKIRSEYVEAFDE
jgi:superfamily II DNA or RNA helicase